MGISRSRELELSSAMKTFAVLSSVLAAAFAAPQVLLAGHAPLVAARAAGQVSHQSVTQGSGEVRRLVQSKAFGSALGSSSQFDNSKGLSEFAQPALGAARPVPVGPAAVVRPAFAVGHASPLVRAPVAFAHAAPLLRPTVVAHAAPVAVAHAVAHPAVYAAGDALAEVSPYNFNYAVADDYSGSSFTAAENSDGLGAKSGSYQVALPDGRTQTVTYTTDDVNGYVADVTYEGVPQYPEAVPVAAPLLVKRPVVAAAPIAVAHAAPFAAPLLSRAVVPAPAVAHPAPAHPLQG